MGVFSLPTLSDSEMGFIGGLWLFILLLHTIAKRQCPELLPFSNVFISVIQQQRQRRHRMEDVILEAYPNPR